MPVIDWRFYDDQIRRMALAGMTASQIAVKTGINVNTIRQRLHGVELTGESRARRAWTAAEDEALMRYRDEKMPLALIARELERTPGSVSQRLITLDKAKEPSRPRRISAPSGGPTAIDQAKRVLRGRLVEKKGELFLDGKWVNTIELLKAANRELQAHGLPLIGKDPLRWM